MGAIPIGQGIAVTAMQMLEAYNVIANDGMYVPPKLVLDTVDHAGNRHPVDSGDPAPGRLDARPPSRCATCWRPWSRRAPAHEAGSRATRWPARRARPASPTPSDGGYKDANGNYHYVATFAGFVPAERPELSIIVVIDEPSGDIYGGSVAAPVFADLAQYGLRAFHIPPPLVSQAPAPDTVAAASATTDATAPTKVRAKAATASAALTGATVDPTAGVTTPSTAASASSPSGGSPPGSTSR